MKRKKEINKNKTKRGVFSLTRTLKPRTLFSSISLSASRLTCSHPKPQNPKPAWTERQRKGVRESDGDSVGDSRRYCRRCVGRNASLPNIHLMKPENLTSSGEWGRSWWLVGVPVMVTARSNGGETAATNQELETLDPVNLCCDSRK